MKIAITTDHTGLAYGNAYAELKTFLQALGHECIDMGPVSLDMDDDYPDFMFAAAKAVASGECEAAIIMGGSGQGEAMAANRIKGARCALFYGVAIAKAPVDAEGDVSNDPYEILRLSRQHNHANILSLAARFLSVDEMKKAIEIWLSTPFSYNDRHERRVKKLDQE